MLCRQFIPCFHFSNPPPSFFFQPVAREVETQAEDEQAFLARQQQSLQAGVPPGVRQESPMRAPPSVTKSVGRQSVGAAGVQTQLGSPKKVTHVPDFFAPLHSCATLLLSGNGIHVTSKLVLGQWFQQHLN